MTRGPVRGGSHRLPFTHTCAERGKAQGADDLMIFAVVASASLLSGVLIHQVGWATLNLATVPFLVTVLLAVAWLRRSGAPAGARPRQVAPQ